MDLLAAVTEGLLGYRAASSRIILISCSRAFGFDKATREFKQASGEHIRRPGTPVRRLGFGGMDVITVAAKVFKHPGMVEDASLRFAFACSDSETMFAGDARDAVAVDNVPPDSPKCREPEPRCSFVRVLGHATKRR